MIKLPSWSSNSRNLFKSIFTLAILMYKSIDSNKAQKRQAQYIGKVMRDEDEKVIKDKLDEVLSKINYLV